MLHTRNGVVISEFIGVVFINNFLIEFNLFFCLVNKRTSKMAFHIVVVTFVIITMFEVQSSSNCNLKYAILIHIFI